jgi:hypothetical protein
LGPIKSEEVHDFLLSLELAPPAHQLQANIHRSCTNTLGDERIREMEDREQLSFCSITEVSTLYILPL